MNSIGFAPSRSVMPNSTMRASGYHAAINTAIFAGTIQRAPRGGPLSPGTPTPALLAALCVRIEQQIAYQKPWSCRRSEVLLQVHALHTADAT